MAFIPRTVAGTIRTPDTAGISDGGRIAFYPSRADALGNDLIIRSKPATDILSSGAFSVDLAVNEDGVTGSHYDVYYEEPKPENPSVWVRKDIIGKISLTSSGSIDFDDLLGAGLTIDGSEPAQYTAIPTANMSGVASGDIVLADDGATFNVPMDGSAFVTGEFDATAGRVVRTTGATGWMGLGSDGLSNLPSDDLEDLSDLCCFFSFDGGSANGHPDLTAGCGIVFPRVGSTESRLMIGNGGDIGVKAYSGGTWSNISVRSSRSSSFVNGLLVQGRSWISVSDSEAKNLNNNQAQAPTLLKASTGVYEISSSTGLAIAGDYERIILPRDEGTGLALVHASVSDSGTVITLSTFDPADGTTPMDIPTGRTVGVKTQIT